MQSENADGDSKETWERETRSLFRFLMCVVAIVFYNRAMPAPFLPLVLAEQFGLNNSAIGLVVALYPVGAILATPLASRIAVESNHILRLHGWTLMAVAASTLLFGVAGSLASVVNKSVVLVLLLALRTLQGATNSLYFSVNTSLITRCFPKDVPYVVGMVEVAVGIGVQVGRLLGAAFCEWGGFLCPFVVAAAGLVAGGASGLFCFRSREPGRGAVEGGDAGACDGDGTNEKTHQNDAVATGWRDVTTPRGLVGVGAVFGNFMVVGLYDATLPQHLEEYLGPLPMSTVGLVLSSRTIAYLVASYMVAQLMNHRLASFEVLIAFGAAFVVLGLVLVAPLGFVSPLLLDLDAAAGGGHSVAWGVQVFAMLSTSLGAAMIFVPALPLMQSEVQHLGRRATESVSSRFVLAMSTGEALGPLLGGWLVDRIGFRAATGAFAVIFVPLFASALAFYNPSIARQRASSRQEMLTALVLESPASGRPSIDLDDESHTWERAVTLQLPVAPEGMLTWRRIPFALGESGARNGVFPGSAPGPSRRRYSREAIGSAWRAPWATAPSAPWRRPYVAERFGMGKSRSAMTTAASQPLLGQKGQGKTPGDGRD